MRLTIPKLRTWHLLAIVAASAALFSAMQYRWSVEDPGYDLVRRLRSLKAAERAKAATELGGYRPRERRAVAPLIELLSDTDAGARAAAARAMLGVIDPEDKEEVGRVKAVLAPALGDRDPGVRRAVAVSLARCGAEPKVVIPALIGLAKDADPQARAEVIRFLGNYARRDESALAAAFATLGDPNPTVRWQAIHSLGYCALTPDLAPEPLLGPITTALEAAADDRSPDVRSAAIFNLGRIGGNMGVEIPRVTEALGDPDADVRSTAVNCLPCGRPGRRSGELVAALGRALADRDARVRRKSAEVLGRLGPDAEAALPALRSSANDPADEVRREVAGAVAAVEKAALDVQPSFAKKIAELDDGDPDVRALAADWLAGAGPRAAGAVPRLVERLADRESDVRRAAADALGQLGPGAAVAVPMLAKLAESDPDERVRRAASLSRSTLADEGIGRDRDP